jgi:hypothetical protein
VEDALAIPGQHDVAAPDTLDPVLDGNPKASPDRVELC